jgi:hypothetical protein
MSMLTPSRNAVFFAQFDAQRNDLPQPVVQQTAFRRVMDVRFHHERIGTHFFNGIRLKFVTFTDDGTADLFDGLRSKQTEVIANGLVVKLGFVVIAQSHDGSQAAMILGKIQQLIVRVVAPEPSRHEHTNVPVVHPFSPGVGASVPVDVIADQPKHVVGEFSIAIHMLQCSENRDDAVAAVEIQLNILDGNTVEPQLI